MILSTTTSDLRGYADTMAAQLELFCGTGFRVFDLSLYNINHKGSSFLANNEDWKKEVYDLGETASKHDFSFRISHSPNGQYFGSAEERENLILTTKRAIEVCGILNIPDIVVHNFGHDALTPLQFMKENKKFNALFFDDMEKHGVNVLVENSTEQNAPHYYLRTGSEMREYIEYVDHPMLFACWDTGHAHMRNMDQYESLVVLGDLLHGMHIADNFGDADSHTAPFLGNCNFDPIIQGLLDIDFKGTFNFESSRILLSHNDWPHQRKSWFYKGEEVTKLHKVPLHLKKLSVALCYEIGKHILESYDCYEY